ncbi:MAG: FeoA family protein [Pseudomonadota bacterium]
MVVIIPMGATKVVLNMFGKARSCEPNEEIKEASCEGCIGIDAALCPHGTVRLSNYRPGEKGKIVRICGKPDFRLRLMEMGFIRGTEVKVVKYAPLTDPIEFELKGYHVTLRRDDASDIIMDQPENAA